MERISASKIRTKRFMKLERSSRSNQLESVSSTSKVQVIEFMLSRFNNYIYECHLASVHLRSLENIVINTCSNCDLHTVLWAWIGFFASWLWCITETLFFQGQRPEDVFQETLKINKKTVVPFPDQMKALKESLTVRQTSFCPSPPFIERMRCKTKWKATHQQIRVR